MGARREGLGLDAAHLPADLLWLARSRALLALVIVLIAPHITNIKQRVILNSKPGIRLLSGTGKILGGFIREAERFTVSSSENKANNGLY